MYKIVMICLGFLMMLSQSARATDPGTPMNCTDLLLSPGLTCNEFSSPGDRGMFRQNDVVVDNDGRILEQGDGSIRDVLVDLGFCGTNKMYELGLVWHVGEGGIRTPIAKVRSRCLDPTTSTVEGLRSASIVFDYLNGVLITVMSSTCTSRSSLCDNYNGGSWIARIEGFKSLPAAFPEPPLAAPLCNNGIDDDNDGVIDSEDQECKSLADNDESRP